MPGLFDALGGLFGGGAGAGAGAQSLLGGPPLPQANPLRSQQPGGGLLGGASEFARNFGTFRINPLTGGVEFGQQGARRNRRLEEAKFLAQERRLNERLRLARSQDERRKILFDMQLLKEKERRSDRESFLRRFGLDGGGDAAPAGEQPSLFNQQLLSPTPGNLPRF